MTALLVFLHIRRRPRRIITRHALVWLLSKMDEGMSVLTTLRSEFLVTQRAFEPLHPSVHIQVATQVFLLRERLFTKRTVVWGHLHVHRFLMLCHVACLRECLGAVVALVLELEMDRLFMLDEAALH